MSPPAVVLYASDEDIAIRSPADFSLICPRDQVLAAAQDGEFRTNDPWTLRSASLNLATCGLMAGQIVQLLEPAGVLGPGGDLLAIAAVTPDGVLLRRKGLPLGVGQPPAPMSGLTGVSFRVMTLTPQIEAASYDLNQRFGLNEQTEGRRSSDLIDPRELRNATILTVLSWRYLDVSQEEDAAPARKAKLIKQQLDELLGRLSLHFTNPDLAPSNRFGTRMTR